MARPAGVRNQDFEEKRGALLRKVTGYLLQDDVVRPSFRQLAIAADSSEPTLRHYFGNRAGVIVEAFKLIRRESEHLRDILRQPQKDCTTAVMSYVDYVLELAKSERYVQAHVLGIRESLDDDGVKEAYLTEFVGPGIEALTERLLGTPGPPHTPEEAQAAAMMIVSSSVTMILHQDVLNGRKYMPVDRKLYLEQFGNWFLRGLDSSRRAPEEPVSKNTH